MHQFKFRIIGVITFVMVLALTACSDSATPLPTTVNSSNQQTPSTETTSGVNLTESVVTGVNISEDAVDGVGLNATSVGSAEVSASNANDAGLTGADVIAVSTSGSPGDYSVSVTVESPDTGCQSYADWWEVITEDGKLLNRRVLLHSHVGEQPFTRSGGQLRIQPDETIIIRAHMSTTGYGGTVMRGTIASGFTSANLAPDFASDLETQSPLPSGCAF